MTRQQTGTFRRLKPKRGSTLCLHDVCKTIPGLLNLLIPQVLLSERQCSCEEMTSGIGSAQNTWQQSGHNTVFRTISTQTPQHFQLYPVTRLTLSSERVLLWLRPVRINSTNDSVSCLHRSSASLHVCVTKTPKFSISAKERSERAPSRQRHDETSSNTRHTHTRTHTRGEGTMQAYCSVPVGNQENAAHADPGSLTPEQCQNTVSDRRHTGMRKRGLAQRLWHCLGTPRGKLVFGTQGKPATSMLVCTNTADTHTQLKVLKSIRKCWKECEAVRLHRD